jgi:hypothetical protein
VRFYVVISHRRGASVSSLDHKDVGSGGALGSEDLGLLLDLLPVYQQEPPSVFRYTHFCIDDHSEPCNQGVLISTTLEPR